MYGLVASGIGLLNESILVERGFTADVYYRALAVTAITRSGRELRRRRARRACVAADDPDGGSPRSRRRSDRAHVSTEAQVMAQAVTMGVGGGFVMVVFFSFWGRAYADALTSVAFRAPRKS